MVITSPEKLEYIQKWRRDNQDRVEQYNKTRKFKAKIQEQEIKDCIKMSVASNDAIRMENLRLINLEKMHKTHVNDRLYAIWWYSCGSMDCVRCGESNIQFLALDHVNNNSYEEKKKIKGDMLKYIIRNNFPEEFQILCHNCNTIKRIERISRKNPNSACNKYRDRVRMEMWIKYSNNNPPKCNCCGFDDTRALTFNHINGGGTRHILKNGPSMAEFLYRNNISTSEINVLCQNCNISLGAYGACPHQSN